MFRSLRVDGNQWKVQVTGWLCVVAVCIPVVQAHAQQLISSPEVGGSVLQRQHLESEKPLTPLDFPEKGESESARREMEEIVRAGPNFEEATVEVYVTGLDREPLDLKEITKIELCAQKQCVPADLAGRVRGLPNEPMETAVLLGKNHMPAGTLTHVRLHAQSQQGSVVISEARLPEPLFLQYMVNRAKLLLALQGGRSLSDASRQEGRAMVRLGAVSATYEYDYPGAEYLFYNPLKGMKVRLSSGVNIEMPAGAFDKPVIFVFMVDDTGGVYPNLNMVPYYSLKKPLKLGVMPFSDYKARLTGRVGDPDSGKLAELVLKEMSVSVWNTKEVANLNFEGMLRGDGQGGWMKEGRFGDSQLLAHKTGLSSCLDFIKNDDFQEKMDLSLKTSGMFYLPMACENIPPYVHLVVTDGWSSSGGGSYDVVFRVLSYRPLEYEWVLSLSRLISYQGFRVMINGFTWRGDKGIFINSGGVAQGFVKGYDYSSGNRYVVGNNIGESGVVDGRKFVAVFHSNSENYFPKWSSDWRLVDGRILDWGIGIKSVVSSSTSILRNGVCSGGNERNRWSAVGETASGRMVFISSTGTGETTGSELCQVFLALGVRNAIRFDGGSAASLVVNGKLLNPLRRLRDLIFGPSRRVAWAFVYR